MIENKDLYDYVADEVYKYLDSTYYNNCVVEFEQSYDGRDWTEERIFIYLGNGGIIYHTDWNEGQHLIRNLKICHFDQMLFPVLSAKG